ncbi:response regulator [Butyrivibrio sp. JL13D10]|uniref:response regulator n=1 Tax=Butyrivibrio sp. JL13D10 TaxID=3236815 RepID=UPI0038B4AA43
MSKKILVVDDSETERLFITEIAKKIEDVEVDDASDFKEARDKLSENKYDLILIDAYMPEGEGAGLWKSVLDDDLLGDEGTNAIIMGHESDFSKEYLAEHGFVNFLEKPIGFHMLKAAISLYA